MTRKPLPTAFAIVDSRPYNRCSHLFDLGVFKMKTMLVLFFAACVCAPAIAEDEVVSQELKALAGTWKLAGEERGGVAVPKDQLFKISFTMHGDGKSTVHVPDGEFETMSTIDPTKSPKTIDIEYLGGLFQGQKQFGIYKVDGDRMTVFSTPPGSKPEERPRAFDSKTGKGSVLVWERVVDDSQR
jgi:uncharacterized protein (TIGR03067 family)